MKKKIGFVGQGWVGKNYANDFEKRGYDVVRYGLEEEYQGNRTKIKECDIVLIAVPTPTTPAGFDDSIVRDVVRLVGKGKIAVIKSTIIPGTTESIQNENPDIFVLHSPEFLTEATAEYDASHPDRNIVGIPTENPEYRAKAEEVLAVLPRALYSRVMLARDAELVKYGGNCLFFVKVVYINLLHDLVNASGGNWAIVREAMIKDSRVAESHTEPVHKTGRGAGGHCFIKDMETFRRLYAERVEDDLGSAVLESLKNKNNHLLKSSGKDLELLRGVFGELF